MLTKSSDLLSSWTRIEVPDETGEAGRGSWISDKQQKYVYYKYVPPIKWDIYLKKNFTVYLKFKFNWTCILSFVKCTKSKLEARFEIFINTQYF